MLIAQIVLCIVLPWLSVAPLATLANDNVQAAKQASSPLQNIAALQAAAEKGDPTAQLNLAKAYEIGSGVPKDPSMAFEWCKKAAEQGDPEAQDTLGLMYRTGGGTEEDKHQAVLWYMKAARQGNADAFYNLGVAYYNGDGVQVDDSLSYAWFVLAKEAGSEQAADAVERAESELKAAQITTGIDKLAELCEKGELVPQNQAEAASWWLKAATRGDEDAEMQIASRLLDGNGVSRDPSRARYWCNQAASAGDIRGEYCMGYTAQHGLGTSPNVKEARKWYGLAAARGNVASMKALAQIEEAERDTSAACVLYAILAVNGDHEAAQELRKLKAQIGPDKWKKVEKQLHLMRIDLAKVQAALQATNGT